MDLAKKHVEWDFFVPRIEIVGGYKAAGKILVLPIVGNGQGNITLCMYIVFKPEAFLIWFKVPFNNMLQVQLGL